MLEAVTANTPGLVCDLEPDSSPYFGVLEAWFPLVGSKIDWGNVPNSIDRYMPGSERQTFGHACVAMVDELVQRVLVSEDDEVVVIGDGGDDDAITLRLGDLKVALPDVVGVAQHTYVLGLAERWCLAFTMEGSLSFGRASTGSSFEGVNRSSTQTG